MKQKKFLFSHRFFCICGFLIALVYSLSALEKPGLTSSPDSLTQKQELEKFNSKNEYVQGVVRSNTHFAADLYQQLKHTEGNLFFSPLSVSISLAMTYGGAKRKTAREMAQVLHFELPSEQLHHGFAEILQHFATSAGESLKLANRVWLQQDYSVVNSFIALTRDRYRSPVAKVDFRGNIDGVYDIINNWVAQRTNNTIQEAIPPDTIDSSTRFVLTNVIYFKDSWLEQFPKENTHDDTFWLSSEGGISVPMMSHEISNFSYAEYPDFEVLELYYLNSPLSMMILLPREIEGLAQLEQHLIADNLTQWSLELRNNLMDFDPECDRALVFLPKFSITSELKLGKILRTMGMRRAFSNSSDFSGISNEDELVLQNVVHKAFIKVDEQGTEAAATTSTSGGTRSVPNFDIVQFKVDRPFIFLIHDLDSDSILFMGRVNNPLLNQ